MQRLGEGGPLVGMAGQRREPIERPGIHGGGQIGKQSTQDGVVRQGVPRGEVVDPLAQRRRQPGGERVPGGQAARIRAISAGSGGSPAWSWRSQ